ncbi:MAG: tetratricopeptide repeat protein [Gammaproteobacteria bacterium]|nr:tetratricopeptide repeat protein [Gammaproteobacteria bacterium]
MKRLSHKFRFILFSPLLVVFITACNVSSVKNQPDEMPPENKEELIKGDDIAETTGSGAAKVGESANSVIMDSDLLFNLLAGEFAGVRGKMQQSINYYSKAAEQCSDPGVISRAAYIALYAGEYEQALELTESWFELGLQADETIDRIRIISFLHLEYLEPSVEAIETMLITDGELNEKVIAPVTHLLSKETTPLFAKQVVQQLNKKNPQQAFLLLLLAKFEANLGEYETALLHVNQLIALNEDLADAYLIQAQIYAGLKNQPAAVESIATAVKKRPEDTRLRLQYGRMLVQMKLFERALEHFKILHKSMPHDENVLLSLGLLSIETDNNQQAKEYLQELLDNGYHNQQAHYYLGRIQQNDNELMAAIANYERVLSGEYWLDARLRAAGLLAKSGETEAALIKLESLTQLEHTDKSKIQVYLAKGEVLRSASRNKEAYKLYNTALAMSPENTDLLYARALTAEKLDMLDVTESDLKMVIMHEPENASALNALGYTLADRTERLIEAREYILKAAELLPDDPAILDSLGWVYFRLGQYSESIKWLTKAFEFLQDAEIAAHLGEALWMDGQTQKAKSIWAKGIKLSGNQDVLRDTMQRLKK